MTNKTLTPKGSIRPSGHIVAEARGLSITLLPNQKGRVFLVWIDGDFEKLRETAADLGMEPSYIGGHYGVLNAGEGAIHAIARALRRNRDARKSEIKEIERILLAAVHHIDTSINDPERTLFDESSED